MKGGKIMFNIFPKRRMSLTEEVLTTVISGAAYVVFVLATPIIEFAEFVREVFTDDTRRHKESR